MTLENFRTDPDNKNPYAFAGTTDAGEKFAWSGYFSLDPLRSQGELSLDKISLNKYAALYQDFVRFEIRGGSIGLHANYRFELSATNHVMAVTNTSFALRHFKLAEPGDSNNIVDLPLFAVAGVSVDLEARQAEVGSVSAAARNCFWAAARTVLQRRGNVQAGRTWPTRPAAFCFSCAPSPTPSRCCSTARTSGAARFTTWTVTNCALHLEDLVNARPAKLDLDDITLVGQKYFQLPHTNLTADAVIALEHQRHHQHRSRRVVLAADRRHRISRSPISISARSTRISNPMVNLLILGSQLGLTGTIHLRTPANELPQVTFQRRRAAG